MNPNHTSKENILVVDDTPDNLRLLSALLSEQGYTVRKALNGQMALTACKTLLPDLILLDVMMPGMDGYQVCQKLKADDKTRGVPVIFISALNDALDKVKAFDVGGVDYITKPFQLAEVLSRIGNQIKVRSLQIKLQEKNILLEQTLSELKSAQVQLIQSEKMVAMGQLVAGIAHEINNPINFIYGNLTYASQYIEDLVNLIEVYQEEFTNPIFTTKPVGSGMGLGLSISYQIVVQKHHGQLRCCSSPGQGAEFAIEIPVHQTMRSHLPC